MKMDGSLNIKTYGQHVDFEIKEYICIINDCFKYKCRAMGIDTALRKSLWAYAVHDESCNKISKIEISVV